MKFPRRQMLTSADAIARQRLLIMTGSEPPECTPEMTTRMKNEIADVIAKYFTFSAEEYEIKVILRQKQERA